MFPKYIWDKFEFGRFLKMKNNKSKSSYPINKVHIYLSVIVAVFMFVLNANTEWNLLIILYLIYGKKQINFLSVKIPTPQIRLPKNLDTKLSTFLALNQDNS